eukprot:CAMPEP_0194142972 /NCGR_PEP_ID=MMETSP0152-20130528/12185_1 /TAXON_ID=1049557 /ORGANISM="Thalassiothrix antarctica, Strain L6-D1" /LENGTH=88 /DNA_ID=CAMNT_0038842163 /DNA_START=1 /DNA_END=263 /DNA_ORIENTATION=+
MNDNDNVFMYDGTGNIPKHGSFVKVVVNTTKEAKKTMNDNDNVFIYDGTGSIPKSVVKVVVKEGVTKIPYQGFYCCDSLVDISLPSSL